MRITIDLWLQDMPPAQQRRQEILKDLEGKFIEILEDPPDPPLEQQYNMDIWDVASLQVGS